MLGSVLASGLYWSIAEAERMVGSAPNTMQVLCVYNMNYTAIIPNGALVAVLQNLFRTDSYYSDKEFWLMSM